MKRGAFSFKCVCLVAMSAAMSFACSIDKRGIAWDRDFDAAVCGASCNDSIPCTVDECRASGCVSVPNHLACTSFPGGMCDPTVGCVYPCNDTTCRPSTECQQTAMCVNDVCVRVPESCP